MTSFIGLVDQVVAKAQNPNIISHYFKYLGCHYICISSLTRLPPISAQLFVHLAYIINEMIYPQFARLAESHRQVAFVSQLTKFSSIAVSMLISNGIVKLTSGHYFKLQQMLDIAFFTLLSLYLVKPRP